MKRKAFITGGGGYVGMNLAAHLERHNFLVFLADLKFSDVQIVCEDRVPVAEQIKVIRIHVFVRVRIIIDILYYLV